MSDTTFKPMSLMDSTHRLRWEVTKEEFDRGQYLDSPNYAIDINGEESQWYLRMYPKGDEEDKNKVIIILGLNKKIKMYQVRCHFRIETQAGQWPNDVVKNMYSRGSYDGGYLFGKDGYWSAGVALCTTEEFETHFVDNKVTVVTSFVIYVEGDKYRKHMEVADDFMDDVRSMSSHDNLSDFKIISGNTEFPCHRVILATRSEYFEALFRNEPAKKDLKVDEAPDVVKAMLEFISKGLIPDDIDDKAMDLILMSDMYGLNLLTVACLTSLMENISSDNAVETFIMTDKVKHVSKSEHREKVLAYIKKEADNVVKTKDWNKFVLSYPDLVTEIILQYHKDVKDVNNGSS